MLKVSSLLVAGAVSVGFLAAGGAMAADVLDTREKGFKAMGGSMKTVSEMVQGRTDYDAAKLEEAVAVLVDRSAEITDWFPEGSGGDEAKPLIWEDWDGFVAKADDAEAAAMAFAAVDFSDKGQVGEALRRMGGTCKACHDRYRDE